MDTNNLRYFAAVAQYGSITRAARAMYISQPQLSHIIKQLEKEMGLTLFRRTSQGTRLTLDGQRILAHSKVILREMDQLRHLSTARKQDCWESAARSACLPTCARQSSLSHCATLPRSNLRLSATSWISWWCVS